jgi:3-deoxy-7-phosphoheptulonate synthase
MIIVLKPKHTPKELTALLKEIKRLGYKPHVMRGVARTVIGAIGDERSHQSLDVLRAWSQVESVTPIQKRHKLVSREAHPQNSTINVRNVVIGGPELVVMAGPCSVESEKQIIETAHGVKSAGAKILRGGAFKPRTSPYEFQGLGEKGLKLLAKARKETGLPVITELLSEDHAELVAEYADILQIGARNAQNFQLLIAGVAEARVVHADRRVAQRRRIRALERQRRADVLRARHPHVRDLHAQHAGPLGGADPEERDALPRGD